MNRPQRKDRKVTLLLSEESLQQLMLFCEKLGLSQAAVVRQALARWYHSDPIMQKPKRRRRVARSTIERGF